MAQTNIYGVAAAKRAQDEGTLHFGDVRVDTIRNQVSTWSGDEWVPVRPELSPGAESLRHFREVVDRILMDLEHDTDMRHPEDMASFLIGRLEGAVVALNVVYFG